MANDDELRDRVHEAADRAGEQMWPMPLPAGAALQPGLPGRRHREHGRAHGRHAGRRACSSRSSWGTRRVGEQIPWAHLDIAGPAFNDGKPWGYTPKGGTGHAVRTLVALAEEQAARA